MSNPASGGVVDVEIPYYGNTRVNWFASFRSFSGSLGHTLNSFAVNLTDEEQPVLAIWDQYISVGEDFNLFFFMGVPAAWKA